MPDSLAEHSTRALLGAFAGGGASPGAGSAVALAAATAAALLERCAGAAARDDLSALANGLREGLVRAADQDALALIALARASSTQPEREVRAALLAACKPPEAVANAADQVADLAARLAGEVPPRLRGEAETARMLASVCATVARKIIEANHAAITPASTGPP
jgi:hypothetical protein